MNHFKIIPNIVTLWLFIFLVLRVFFLGVNHWRVLATPIDISQIEFKYQHSQFNLGNAEFYGNIDDDELYTYAGYRYVIGDDPSTVNFETPYLVKYLYGLSIHIFGNPFILQFLLGLCLLVLMIAVGLVITNSLLLAVSGALLLSFDGLFIAQWFRPLLDLPHGLFILLSSLCYALYFKAKPRNKPKYLLALSIAIGLVASTKLPLTAGLLVIIFGLIIPSNIKNYVLLLLPASIVYLSSFGTFWWYHPNPLDFIKLHVEILRLYRSYVPEYPWGEIIRIIVLGRWQTWWGPGIVKVSEWNLFWPLGLATAIGWTFRGPATKKSDLVLLQSWFQINRNPVVVVCYIIIGYLLINLTHVVFPRYLLSILPLIYLVLAKNIANWIEVRTQKR